MTWERFVAAMAMLRICYPWRDDPAEWEQRVKAYWLRLRPWPERVVMRALDEAPTAYRERMPTLGQLDELCRKHDKMLKADTPSLGPAKLTAPERQRMGEFLRACVDDAAEAKRMAQWAIDVDKASWEEGYEQPNRTRGDAYARERGWHS